ncbi:MAG: hypothetical protein SF187_06625 [Deltaproteobacteria bacterium]|nr:hypothetical protein [Deltaproteobacteria bacterium]
MTKSSANKLIALLVAATVMNPGCSWIFTTPPPSNHEVLPYFDCSTSRFPAVLDTIFTLTNLVSTGVAIAEAEDDQTRQSAVGLGLSVATLWALSASYGYSRTSQCEDAKNQLNLRLIRQQPSAAPYPAYAPPYGAPPAGAANPYPYGPPQNPYGAYAPPGYPYYPPPPAAPPQGPAPVPQSPSNAAPPSAGPNTPVPPPTPPAPPPPPARREPLPPRSSIDGEPQPRLLPPLRLQAINILQMRSSWHPVR